MLKQNRGPPDIRGPPTRHESLPQRKEIPMLINKNLARHLQRVKVERRLSLAEFATELTIPISSLEAYISGTGNPRADTLEMLAEKLNIPITEIVSGPLPGQEKAETIIRAAKELSGLSQDRRERGMQLFQELTALFSEEKPE